MPTGYTAGVQSGEITEFRDFALACARAFGALVTMREDASDAPIPVELIAETAYHDKALETALSALTSLETMTIEECQSMAMQDFTEQTKHFDARRKERLEQKTRYEAMLAKVAQFKPPSKDHWGLYDFMVRQLQDSISHDCDGTYDKHPVLLSGPAWRSEHMERARRDINYHTKARTEEIERTENRNLWLKQLREALK